MTATAPAELIRTFTPQLEIRSAAKGGDGRIVDGIAVPYGIAQRIDSQLVERFAPGVFNHQLGAPHRVRFTREHMSWGGALIGRALELRDDPAGLWGAWRVSRTAAGDETLTLIEDGVLHQLSVGFRERAKGNRVVTDVDPDTGEAVQVVERVKADLVEVSVVLQGAYGDGAAVLGTRHLGHPCRCGAGQPDGHALLAEVLAAPRP